MSKTGSLDVSDLWVSKTSLSILESLWSLDILMSKDNSLDDVDGVSSSTVSTSNLVVQLGDGSAERVVSVFLVHVDDIVSGLILHDNTVVSNGVGVSLVDFTD